MTILGVLQVQGKYDGRKFDKPIDKSRGKTKQFRGEVKGLSSQLKTFGGILAGGFAIAGIQRFASGQLQAIDTLAKTSRQLGITTEALGAYQYAAGLSGLSTDQLQNSLARMQDTIGAGLLGEAGAIRPLEALGLTPEQLSKSGRPLEIIQERLAGITDQAKKVAIVRDIFGRQGAQILNLYEQNLSGVRKEYEKLGLSVSGEEAARIEKFNDSLSILSQRFAAVGRNLLIDVTPAALEALQGAEVILEATGVIKSTSAKQQVEDRKKKLALERGEVFNEPTNIRRAVIEGLGEFLALAGTDPALRNQNYRSQMRLERSRRAQIDGRSVVLSPAPGIN